ncbi:MAG: FtsX-like permease family protein [Treponema sp.]|jgi:ABC-type lipoprotein release transport system permease subunit|nr:FtsX-like permease family protein [Treponema sp.]
MEKTSTLLRLGLKYLFRYRRRYGFLVAALVFCFAVVTFITSQRDGMSDNLYHNAQSHYAGDIVAMGYNTDFVQTHHLRQNEIYTILNAAQVIGMNPAYTVVRTIHFRNGVVHFNGIAVPLRHIIGSDWDGEAHLFRRKTFLQPPERMDFGDDGIVLSSPTAQILGARMGDSVLLETETKYGQRNTGFFIVRAIVQDTSIFGHYKAYVSRLSLNRLMLFADDEASSIGFFLRNPAHAERQRLLLYRELTGQVPLVPLVHDRDEFARSRRYFEPGANVALYTLAVYLSEVADMLNAMNLIAYFLYGMMLLIILVSAAVTYRLILHERTRELGTMRAIGFFGADLRLVLWVEVLGVAIFSLFAGFVLAGILNWVASLLSFAWFPSFEIFMRDGRLTALYRPGTMITNVVSVFVLLFLVVMFPSFKASRKNLPGLLSGEPL